MYVHSQGTLFPPTVPRPSCEKVQASMQKNIEEGLDLEHCLPLLFASFPSMLTSLSGIGSLSLSLFRVGGRGSIQAPTPCGLHTRDSWRDRLPPGIISQEGPAVSALSLSLCFAWGVRQEQSYGPRAVCTTPSNITFSLSLSLSVLPQGLGDELGPPATRAPQFSGSL